MLTGVINTNVNALYALNALNGTTSAVNTLEQQLSSGLSINSPADNPAGYIAAQGFTSQLSGTNQAISNANQAISLVQTGDGAITQQVNILQNILSIASQAANGTNTSQQLASLQQVVSQLQTEVSSISSQTNFNGVNLLDGTFQNVKFQVGAQAGQTIGLTIGSTAANAIGAYQSTANAAIYTGTGSGTGGVGDSTGNAFTITASAGAFTAGNVGVSGSSGNSNVAIAQLESAQNFATGVNAVTSKTNVSATADTSVAFAVTTGAISFTLGNGTTAAQTNSVNISGTISSATAAGLANIVSQINNATGQTGIVASFDANNHLVLTQSQGDNITFTGASLAVGTASLTAKGVQVGGVGGSATGLVQGVATLQSTQSFGLSNTDAGLAVTSSLSALSAVNVSTQAGATAALNVVNFALQQLENVGGQLGAIQQELQATVSNLQSTSTNITAARGVVQDANIPQVTTQLTQQEILQQAGVSALAQSSTLQQSFLKLLQ